jgi:hypothetical protein
MNFNEIARSQQQRASYTPDGAVELVMPHTGFW